MEIRTEGIKMKGKDFKKMDISKLEVLYEKALKKASLLFSEGSKLYQEANCYQHYGRKVAYWLGKKKAINCLAFRKINKYYGKCLSYSSKLELTLQYLFREECARCKLTDNEKRTKILINKLKGGH